VDLPRDLVKTINDPDSLNQSMSAAFIDMRKATGWNVPMFDVKAANIWCSQHKCASSPYECANAPPCILLYFVVLNARTAF
jgi:hypothetical protein